MQIKHKKTANVSFDVKKYFVFGLYLLRTFHQHHIEIPPRTEWETITASRYQTDQAMFYPLFVLD